MKKYIDAEGVMRACYDSFLKTGNKAYREIFALVEAVPAASVVAVVRCRECVMWDDSFVLNGKKRCLNIGVCTDGDFYCGWGSKAKMEEEENE